MSLIFVNQAITMLDFDALHHHPLVQNHQYESETYDLVTSDWVNGIFISLLAVTAVLYAFGLWGAWELTKYIVRVY